MEYRRRMLYGCWLLAALGCAGPSLPAGECGTMTIRGFAENDQRKVKTGLLHSAIGVKI